MAKSASQPWSVIRASTFSVTSGCEPRMHDAMTKLYSYALATWPSSSKVNLIKVEARARAEAGGRIWDGSELG